MPLAAAAIVHIRVEGKTLTIFGPTNPTIVATTPLDALQAAAKAGEFYDHVTASSFGNYVDQIGFYPGSGDAGWVFKVNGASPPVGADQVQLKDGDVVEWYYADVRRQRRAADARPDEGPADVLPRRRAERRGCEVRRSPGSPSTSTAARVKTQAATGAVVACIPGTHGLVWATAPGAVRSNRLP